MSAIEGYLRKRAVHAPWATVAGGPTPRPIHTVVAIPVLAEYDRLFDTLRDLAANDVSLLAESAIVCVVNNRADAPLHDQEDNRRTLMKLPEFTRAHPELRLSWIDASSPGRALGPKEGVGLARKLGLDWGLQLLSDAGTPECPLVLVCLDADTRVQPNYLAAIRAFFADRPRWAAVVDYAHPVDATAAEHAPILAYELFLRYQEMAWHYAGSPYAYPAIGSTMVCTGLAYATAGGMNRRQAGEDFYFLQQLAKTGKVERIRGTVVAPSGRPSHRVPFGTGRKVGAFDSDPDDAYLTYDPASYRIVRAWLQLAEENLDATGAALLAGAADVAPELAHFLAAQRLAESWDRIAAHSPASTQRLRQFHQWFDAFRTLKLVHHLRDHGYPRQDLFEALGALSKWQHLGLKVPHGLGLRHDLDGQQRLLNQLRSWRPSSAVND